MTTLAYIYGAEFSERRSGIFAQASESGVRVMSFQTGFLGASLRDILEIARPDVCIVESDYILENHLIPDDFHVPVVVCDLEQGQARSGFTGIMHDRSSAAVKAMDALLKLGLSHYGFVGYHRPTEWSIRREQVYLETLKAEGLTPHRLTFARRRRLPDFMRALEKWLTALPTPCGILAVNDEIGEYVLTAAKRLGIPVPESLAVVGIDNDAERCENTVPPLASVSMDFVQSGRLAVTFALQLVNQPRRLSKPITYGSGILISRGSLRRFRRHDSAAAKGLDFIRQHATDRKLDLRSVAKVMDLPISTARVRFQRYTGHTIFDEIEDQRFLIACSLMQKRNLKISSLHAQCGYGCDRALRNVFLKRTGQSPSAWRKLHT